MILFVLSNDIVTKNTSPWLKALNVFERITLPASGTGVGEGVGVGVGSIFECA